MKITRDGKYQIEYTDDDGNSSAFRCSEQFADWVMFNTLESGTSYGTQKDATKLALKDLQGTKLLEDLATGLLQIANRDDPTADVVQAFPLDAVHIDVGMEKLYVLLCTNNIADWIRKKLEDERGTVSDG